MCVGLKQNKIKHSFVFRFPSKLLRLEHFTSSPVDIDSLAEFTLEFNSQDVFHSQHLTVIPTSFYDFQAYNRLSFKVLDNFCIWMNAGNKWTISLQFRFNLIKWLTF